MRILIAIVFTTVSFAARAEDAPQSAPSPRETLSGRLPPVSAPDPNTPITLTFGQIQAIIAAQAAQDAAAPALKSLQDQVAAAAKPH